MKTVRVEASRSYDVIIENGGINSCGDYIGGVFKGKRLMVVSDDIVFPIYGERVIKSLEASGFTVESFVIPNGEGSKSLSRYESLLDSMLMFRMTRSDGLVALGGGVVGDLTGFAAATYQRGIEFFQLPTTLLAMVDSSVGGKTAVNLTHGKNQVGAFWQPSCVVCDPSALDTLPQEQLLCGCAEVIKYAVLGDVRLFCLLEDCMRNSSLSKSLEDIITTCVNIKRDIVHRDEFDRGGRMVLNLGHTIGHAVEALSGFRQLHGQAVAIGLVMISRAAMKRGLLPESDFYRILGLVKGFGLPYSTEYSKEELFLASLSDKKAAGDSITVVVPVAIGRTRLLRLPCSELIDWIEP